MDLNGILLGACLASTWFMAGLIWFVQVVHYPLFERVGHSGFREYHHLHTKRTTWLVLGPMLVELLSSLGLVLDPEPEFGLFLPWIGLISVGICWLSTALVQVPLHQRLAEGYAPGVVVSLVRSNLVRTVGWTIHAIAVLAMIVRSKPC